ncbi:hypothetical protein PCCS19_36250 [Paenibacillus sp. CCS19]|nr:hypothetical protein PCCS19_36250 [Paenibacillus cellulosilyticus]
MSIKEPAYERAGSFLRRGMNHGSVMSENDTFVFDISLHIIYVKFT